MEKKASVTMETMDTNSVPWGLQRVAEDEAGEVDGGGGGLVDCDFYLKDHGKARREFKQRGAKQVIFAFRQFMQLAV